MTQQAQESRQARIAIPQPTSNEPDYNHRSWPQYAAAIRAVGGIPVPVPLTLHPAEIARLVTSCQGILLPGSPADVNPQKYSADAIPATAAADPSRESVDDLLLQDAHNLYKPILGICYGVQSLNVWRSGTLVQDLPPVPVNHSAGGSVAVAHSVRIEPESRFFDMIAGCSDIEVRESGFRLPVNSSHHQSVGVAGDGLRVVAHCPQDEVIEAVEGTQPGHFVLGLQWHPERSVEISPVSQRIFERFVAAARDWHPRLVSESVA